MRFQAGVKPNKTWVVAGCIAATCVGVVAAATIEVSQRGRMFNPSEVSIKRGEPLRIVNNDGELLHHAYVESPGFNFDSGEQEPGQSVEIRFPAVGSYEVLCGIHPKMRLKVTVK